MAQAALPRRKLRTAATTSAAAMSGTSVRAGGPSGNRAARAGWARGCLARSLSITPGECRTSAGATEAAQARESSPSAASWRQRSCWEERSSSLVPARRLRRRPWPSGHSSSLSPASQRAHRREVKRAACSRRLAPPRGAGINTALGSIKSWPQAAMELVVATAARARAKHWAQTPRAALGTWRSTGTPAAQTWAMSGPKSASPCGTAASPMAARAAGRQRGCTPL